LEKLGYKGVSQGAARDEEENRKQEEEGDSPVERIEGVVSYGRGNPEVLKNPRRPIFRVAPSREEKEC